MDKCMGDWSRLPLPSLHRCRRRNLKLICAFDGFFNRSLCVLSVECRFSVSAPKPVAPRPADLVGAWDSGVEAAASGLLAQLQKDGT